MYILQAFIMRKSDQYKLTDHYKHAISIDIGYKLSLIPLTTELFDEMNKQATSALIGQFNYLTENIEIELLQSCENTQMIYIEADYWGGKGTQIVIIWENKQRRYLSHFTDREINKALKALNIVAAQGKDEFDTVGLGRHRTTEDWLTENKN